MRDRLIELLKGAETKVTEMLSTSLALEEWLGIYADHLLANGVIVPPCKVGDTVYEIQPIRQRIQAYEVTTVKYNGHYYWFTWVIKDRRGHYGNVEGFTDMQIGKTVFLTREEAERALKERERK